MKHDKKIMVLFLCAFFILGCNRNEEAKPKEEENMEGGMKINLEIAGKSYLALLEDNETTKELLELLPFELYMNDLNQNEKYFYFEENLTTDSYAPKKIKKGDIMLYESNCIVLFYEDFDTTYSYTRLGHIEDVTNLKEDLGSGSVLVGHSFKSAKKR